MLRKRVSENEIVLAWDKSFGDLDWIAGIASRKISETRRVIRVSSFADSSLFSIVEEAASVCGLVLVAHGDGNSFVYSDRGRSTIKYFPDDWFGETQIPFAIIAFGCFTVHCCDYYGLEGRHSGYVGYTERVRFFASNRSAADLVEEFLGHYFEVVAAVFPIVTVSDAVNAISDCYVKNMFRISESYDAARGDYVNLLYLEAQINTIDTC